MSFLLRAALAIGALSYFALRDAPGRGHAYDRAALERQTENLSAALKGLPAEVGAKATQAAETAVEAEILRRLAQARSSQDTLATTDRRPSWRGAQVR